MKIMMWQLAAVVLGVTASACSPAVSMKIPNPLQGGKVSENVIEFPNAGAEQAYEIEPGTLTQKATLASLDQKEVCFDVQLASLSERKDLASPKGWRIFLRGDPDFEDMTPQIREVAELSEKQVSGSVERQAKTTERVCDANGNNCINGESVTTYREPAMLKVYMGGGTVCFANKGHIKKSTEQITLHMDDPNPNFAEKGGNMNFFAALNNRVAFRWEFN
jgi:hypothetical protein